MNDFNSIIDEFYKNISVTFPDKNIDKDIDKNIIYKHCYDIFPKYFSEILNEDNILFENELYLLPNINISELMNDDKLSDKSKKIIWKYLQMILFHIVEKIKEDKTNPLSENEFNERIEESIEEIKSMFKNEDVSGMNESMMNDSSNNFTDNENLKSNLDKIMSGKIGSIAKEIAEETTKELGTENEEEAIKHLFNNPKNLFGIVNKLGDKLNDKELIDEIMNDNDILGNMTNIVKDMENNPMMKQMMRQMGMNGKMDFNSMNQKFQQQNKRDKMKEKLKEKLERKQNLKETDAILEKVDENTYKFKSKSKRKKKNNRKVI